MGEARSVERGARLASSRLFWRGWSERCGSCRGHQANTKEQLWEEIPCSDSYRRPQARTAAAAALCASLGLFSTGTAAAETWKFYMHQSAPNFATSRGAKLFTEEIEKATNGELKVRLHLSGTLQINASNITQAVGENIVQIGDDLFNSGNIPVAGIPRLPMLIQSYEDFAKADAVLKPYIEKAFAAEGLDRARLLQLSDAVRVGAQEARVARGHQGHEAARRAARAGRVRAPVRRHVDHHERAGSAFRARSRRGGRDLHRRRRRRAVERPAEIRLRPDRATSTTPISSPTPRPTTSCRRICRPSCARSLPTIGALESGHHEDGRGGLGARRWRMPDTRSPRPNRKKSRGRSTP